MRGVASLKSPWSGVTVRQASPHWEAASRGNTLLGHYLTASPLAKLHVLRECYRSQSKNGLQSAAVRQFQALGRFL
jgi:hypothetical protein